MREFGPLVSLDRPAFIHDTVEIYGRNQIGEGVSIWPRVVMRAEMFENVIGPFSNLQDFVMVHVGDTCGTTVGAYCSITHRATLHGCRIGDNCIVAGHSIVTPGTVIPANSIVAGVPGKIMRSQDDFIANRMNALLYHRNGLAYARGEHRAWDGEQARLAFEEERRRVTQAYAERDNKTGEA